MSLALKARQPTSVHDVVAEFLLNELHKVVQLSLDQHMMGVVENPNTKNPDDNHLRLRILTYLRGSLVGEIPPDTRWFEVHSLSKGDLAELRVIARCGWDDPADQNELIKVAKRKPEPLSAAPAAWRKPILWGHDQTGPFTILEGNHRLVAYAAADDPPDLCIPVIVGLSPTPCFFHMPDPPHFIANDLWKNPPPPFWY
jgi:hypothetical protein